jgi:hypothetical protein
MCPLHLCIFHNAAQPRCGIGSRLLAARASPRGGSAWHACPLARRCRTLLLSHRCILLVPYCQRHLLLCLLKGIKEQGFQVLPHRRFTDKIIAQARERHRAETAVKVRGICSSRRQREQGRGLMG